MAFVSIISEASRQGKRVYISSDSLGIFTLDVINNELHVSKLRVTENPIESGSTVADHAVTEPKEVTMTGIIVGYNPNSRFHVMEALGLGRLKVKEYPLPVDLKAIMGIVESKVDRVVTATQNAVKTAKDVANDLTPNIDVKKFDSSTTSDRIATAYNALLNVQSKGGLLRVVTHAKVYHNMLITSISMTQSDALSASLTITFKEVVIAKTQQGKGFTTYSNLGRVDYSNQKSKSISKAFVGSIIGK